MTTATPTLVDVLIDASAVGPQGEKAFEICFGLAPASHVMCHALTEVVGI